MQRGTDTPVSPWALRWVEINMEARTSRRNSGVSQECAVVVAGAGRFSFSGYDFMFNGND